MFSRKKRRNNLSFFWAMKSELKHRHSTFDLFLPSLNVLFAVFTPKIDENVQECVFSELNDASANYPCKTSLSVDFDFA